MFILRKSPTFCRILSCLLSVVFFMSLMTPPGVYAQQINVPQLGAILAPNPAFNPTMIKGMTIHPSDPYLFDFIIHPGDGNLEGEAFRAESNKLIKYFMAAMTTPEDEMWVNLSPYEENRIVPQGFGETEMGRDLLAQDYLLKQLTASLISPVNEHGAKFWERIKADIPMNILSKVWIVPEKATIYEAGTSAFVVDAYLRVKMEEESKIFRDLIIPAIEHEVNNGEQFANLRQITNAVVLATWYKQNVQGSILEQIYINQNKTQGISTDDKQSTQKIYNQYVEAFKHGVADFVQEEYDPVTQDVIPRKYFTGGASLDYAMAGIKEGKDPFQLIEPLRKSMTVQMRIEKADHAMSDVPVNIPHNVFNMKELIEKGYTVYKTPNSEFLFLFRHGANSTKAHLGHTDYRIDVIVKNEVNSGKPKHVGYIDSTKIYDGFFGVQHMLWDDTDPHDPFPLNEEQQAKFIEFFPDGDFVEEEAWARNQGFLAVRLDYSYMNYSPQKIERYPKVKSAQEFNLGKLLFELSFEILRLNGATKVTPGLSFTPGLKRYFVQMFGYGDETMLLEHERLSQRYVRAVKDASGNVERFLVAQGVDVMFEPEGGAAETESEAMSTIRIPQSIGREIRSGRIVVNGAAFNALHFLGFHSLKVYEAIVKAGDDDDKAAKDSNKIIRDNLETKAAGFYVHRDLLEGESLIASAADDWYEGITPERALQILKRGHIVVKESLATDVEVWAHEELHKLWAQQETQEIEKLDRIYQEFKDFLKTLSFDSTASEEFAQFFQLDVDVEIGQIVSIYDLFFELLRDNEHYQDMDAEEFWIHLADFRALEEFIIKDPFTSKEIMIKDHVVYFIKKIFNYALESAQLGGESIQYRLQEGLRIIKAKQALAEREAKMNAELAVSSRKAGNGQKRSEAMVGESQDAAMILSFIDLPGQRPVKNFRYYDEFWQAIEKENSGTIAHVHRVLSTPFDQLEAGVDYFEPDEWKNMPSKMNQPTRTIILPLEKPVMIKGRWIRAIKLKGARLDKKDAGRHFIANILRNQLLRTRMSDDHVQDMLVDLSKKDVLDGFTIDGRYQSVEEKKVPFRGNLLSLSGKEFEIWDYALDRMDNTPVPLGYGQFEGMQTSEGEDIGFVALGIPDKFDKRLGDSLNELYQITSGADLIDRFLKIRYQKNRLAYQFGQELREAHRNGLAHVQYYYNNVSVIEGDHNSTIFIHDGSSVHLRKDMNDRQFFGFLAISFSRAFDDMYSQQLREQGNIGGPANYAGSFVDGYFQRTGGVGSPELQDLYFPSVYEIQRLAKDTPIDQVDHGIIKKLKKEWEGHFDISEAMVTMGDAAMSEDILYKFPEEELYTVEQYTMRASVQPQIEAVLKDVSGLRKGNYDDAVVMWRRIRETLTQNMRYKQIGDNIAGERSLFQSVGVDVLKVWEEQKWMNAFHPMAVPLYIGEETAYMFALNFVRRMSFRSAVTDPVARSYMLWGLGVGNALHVLGNGFHLEGMRIEREEVLKAMRVAGLNIYAKKTKYGNYVANLDYDMMRVAAKELMKLLVDERENSDFDQKVLFNNELEISLRDALFWGLALMVHPYTNDPTHLYQVQFGTSLNPKEARLIIDEMNGTTNTIEARDNNLRSLFKDIDDEGDRRYLFTQMNDRLDRLRSLGIIDSRVSAWYPNIFKQLDQHFWAHYPFLPNPTIAGELIQYTQPIFYVMTHMDFQNLDIAKRHNHFAYKNGALARYQFSRLPEILNFGKAEVREGEVLEGDRLFLKPVFDPTFKRGAVRVINPYTSALETFQLAEKLGVKGNFTQLFIPGKAHFGEGLTPHISIPGQSEAVFLFSQDPVASPAAAMVADPAQTKRDAAMSLPMFSVGEKINGYTIAAVASTLSGFTGEEVNYDVVRMLRQAEYETLEDVRSRQGRVSASGGSMVISSISDVEGYLLRIATNLKHLTNSDWPSRLGFYLLEDPFKGVNVGQPVLALEEGITIVRQQDGEQVVNWSNDRVQDNRPLEEKMSEYRAYLEKIAQWPGEAYAGLLEQIRFVESKGFVWDRHPTNLMHAASSFGIIDVIQGPGTIRLDRVLSSIIVDDGFPKELKNEEVFGYIYQVMDTLFQAARADDQWTFDLGEQTGLMDGILLMLNIDLSWSEVQKRLEKGENFLAIVDSTAAMVGDAAMGTENIDKLRDLIDMHKAAREFIEDLDDVAWNQRWVGTNRGYKKILQERDFFNRQGLDDASIWGIGEELLALEIENVEDDKWGPVRNLFSIMWASKFPFERSKFDKAADGLFEILQQRDQEIEIVRIVADIEPWQNAYLLEQNYPWGERLKNAYESLLAGVPRYYTAANFLEQLFQIADAREEVDGIDDATDLIDSIVTPEGLVATYRDLLERVEKSHLKDPDKDKVRKFISGRLASTEKHFSVSAAMTSYIHSVERGESGNSLEHIVRERELMRTLVRLLNPDRNMTDTLLTNDRVRLHRGDIEGLTRVLPGTKVLLFDNDKFLTFPPVDITAKELEAIHKQIETLGDINRSNNPMPQKYRLSETNLILLRKYLEQGGIAVFISGGHINNLYLRLAVDLPKHLRKKILFAHSGGKQVFGFHENGDINEEPVLDLLGKYYGEHGIDPEEMGDKWLPIIDKAEEIFALDATEIAGVSLPDVHIDRRFDRLGYQKGLPVQMTFKFERRRAHLDQQPLVDRKAVYAAINDNIEHFNEENRGANIPSLDVNMSTMDMLPSLIAFLSYQFKSEEQRLQNGDLLDKHLGFHFEEGSAEFLDVGVKGVKKQQAVVEILNSEILESKRLLGRKVRASEILVGEDSVKTLGQMLAGIYEAARKLEGRPEDTRGILIPESPVSPDNEFIRQFAEQIDILNNAYDETYEAIAAFIIAQTLLTQPGNPAMTTRLILGDDSTSAQESALALLENTGESVLVLDDVNLLNTALASDERSIVVNTGTRALSREEADAVNQRVIKNVGEEQNLPDLQINPKLFSSDKSLRGLIRQGDDYDYLFFVPAAPTFKRIIRNGIHYVEEDGGWVELHESSIAKMFEEPLENSSVGNFLERQLGIEGNKIISIPEGVMDEGPEAISRYLDEQPKEKGSIIIPDITNNDHVNHIAEVSLRLEADDNTVMRAGSSFLLRALMEKESVLAPTASQAREFQPINRKGAPVTIAGSFNEVTSQQLEKVKELEGGFVHTVTLDIDKVLDPKWRRETILVARYEAVAYLREQIPLIIQSERSQRDLTPEESQIIVDALSDVVNDEEIRSLMTALFLTGGHTVDAFKKSVGAKGAIIEGRFSDRMTPWGYLYQGSAPEIPIISKGGGMGSPEVIKEFFEKSLTERKDTIPMGEDSLYEPLPEFDNKIVQNRITGRITFADRENPEPIIEPDFDFMIVRHGQTNANLGGTFQGGGVDEKMNQLNEVGRRQAEKRAIILFDQIRSYIEKIRRGERKRIVILLSPLGRARDTGEAFLRYAEEQLKELDVVLDEIFEIVYDEVGAAERDYGALENKTEQEIKDGLGEKVYELMMRERYGLDGSARPPDGQSANDYAEEKREWVKDLNHRYSKRFVIAFSHGQNSSALRMNLGETSLLDETGHIKWRGEKLLSNAGGHMLWNKSGDLAMIGSTKTPGGIDMNPTHIEIETVGDGKIVFPALPEGADAAQVNGFVPIIININPVTNVPLLLGIKEEEDELELSQL